MFRDFLHRLPGLEREWLEQVANGQSIGRLRGARALAG